MMPTRAILRRIAVSAFLLLACCTGTPTPAPPGAVHIVSRPPSPKDLIEAVLASHDTTLKVSSTCASVGTEPTDATIGRYLAGFLAEMQTPQKNNWVETSTQVGASARGEPVWICNFTLRHVDGDDRWGWGVRFQVRQSDGLVLSDSFECTGAG